MKRNSFTLEQFNEYKQNAVANDPKVFTTNLGLIVVEPESYDKGYIIVNIDGKPQRVAVANTFFAEFTKMLSVDKKLQGKMNVGKDDNKSFANLLEALKVIQNSANSKEVALVFDTVANKITHITDSGYNRLANVELFNFAEALISKYPFLHMKEILGGQTSSDIELRILSENDFDFGDDEQFQFGVTLSNKGVVTSLGDFAYRLICANGMMGIKTDERFTLSGTASEDLHQLFAHFETMESANFLPSDFEENMRNAMELPASFAELSTAVRNVSSMIVGEFPEQKEQWIAGMIAQHFPAYNVVLQKLKSKGYEVADLTKKQMQLVKTDMPMWDMVNALTFLGSNEVPFILTNKPYLQTLGGRMLAKEHDMKHIGLIYL